MSGKIEIFIDREHIARGKLLDYLCIGYLGIEHGRSSAVRSRVRYLWNNDECNSMEGIARALNQQNRHVIWKVGISPDSEGKFGLWYAESDGNYDRSFKRLLAVVSKVDIGSVSALNEEIMVDSNQWGGFFNV